MYPHAQPVQRVQDPGKDIKDTGYIPMPSQLKNNAGPGLHPHAQQHLGHGGLRKGGTGSRLHPHTQPVQEMQNQGASYSQLSQGVQGKGMQDPGCAPSAQPV